MTDPSLDKAVREKKLQPAYSSQPPFQTEHPPIPPP